jgi:hypothetical protein
LELDPAQYIPALAGPEPEDGIRVGIGLRKKLRGRFPFIDAQGRVDAES